MPGRGDDDVTTIAPPVDTEPERTRLRAVLPDGLLHVPQRLRGHPVEVAEPPTAGYVRDGIRETGPVRVDERRQRQLPAHARIGVDDIDAARPAGDADASAGVTPPPPLD